MSETLRYCAFGCVLLAAALVAMPSYVSVMESELLRGEVYLSICGPGIGVFTDGFAAASPLR